MVLRTDHHGGAVLDWQHRFWRLTSSEEMVPVSLRVRNLGDEIGTQHYRE